MGQFKDLSGQQFGEMTVLEKDIKLSTEKSRIYWKCQCSCGRIKSIRADGLKKIKTCGECSKDLTNQQFGRLIAIQKGKKDKAGHQYWICQCNCGNIVEVNSDNLRRGLTQSCGCLHSEVTSSLHFEDLTHQTFGMLTVLHRSSKIGDKRVKWICQCECGNLVDVQANNLKSGHTTSCGCVNSLGEKIIGDILRENNIIFQKEFIFTDLPNRRFDFGIIDNNNQLLYLIEFDGKQHFQECGGSWDENDNLEQRQARDKIKNNYAISNNIDLVRIPYWKRDTITIEMLLEDEYLIKGE